MNAKIHELIEKHKAQVEFRTDRTQTNFGSPQWTQAPVAYQLAEKTQAVAHGGLALIHQIVLRTGLYDALNSVPVLKIHLPYTEADHLLNIAYNFFCGGTALEHIEYRRQDPVHLDMPGTRSIPDPTTAGDFCRRYSATQIDALQDAIHEIRLNVRSLQGRSFFDEAVVDTDGTIAPTGGRCKQGMDISYKGDWGCHPLIVSLAKTKEVLYVRNRSGNRPSHEDAHLDVDKCIVLLKKAGFKKIRFRGDGDFSQTAYLDGWDDEGVFFTFGIDAMPKLVDIAENPGNKAWNRLSRPAKYDVKTTPRGRRENVKDRIVEQREFLKLELHHEDVAEVEYRPGKCKKDYRPVILRKTITVKKGQKLLLPEIRYFFYLTNDETRTAPEVVFDANDRCDQENLIGVLKSGMNAMRMPLDNLYGNWAYLVAASPAWTLKSWTGLILPADGRKPKEVATKKRLLGMEFRTFLQALVTVPAQVLESGRRIIARLLNVNGRTETFFRLYEALRRPQLE
jgi:hypothetical protein